MDGKEYEKICITKRHKSSLVQWGPHPSACGLVRGAAGREREMREKERKGSSRFGLEASPKPARPLIKFIHLLSLEIPIKSLTCGWLYSGAIGV